MAARPSALNSDATSTISRDNHPSLTPTTQTLFTTTPRRTSGDQILRQSTCPLVGSLLEKRKASGEAPRTCLCSEKRRCVRKYVTTPIVGKDMRRLNTPGQMLKSWPRNDNVLEPIDVLVEELCCPEGDARVEQERSEFIKATQEALLRQRSWDSLLSLFENVSETRSLYYLSLALYQAVSHRCINGVRAVLSVERTDPSRDQYKALRDCIQTGFAKGLVLLLDDARVDPNKARFCPFEVAIENHQRRVVRILLEDGRCDPSSTRNAPLRLSSLQGDVGIVELLLQSERVDPGDKANEAIRVASKRGDVNIVKALLYSSKVDPSANGSEALRWAAAGGHKDVVRELLMDRRVNPTAMNYEALRRAHEARHSRIAEMLLYDRRVRGTMGASVVRSKLVNDSQRRKLGRLNRFCEAMASDVDHDFSKRYEAHLLRVLLVGAVQELCVDSTSILPSDEDGDSTDEADSCVIAWDSSDSEGDRNDRNENLDDRKLQRVFRKNLEAFLPKRLQGLLRNVTPSFQLYKKLFQNYKRGERLQFLFEWKFNFQGKPGKDLLDHGFRPSAMKIGQVKSFPEMFLFAKNTHMAFVAKKLGKVFAQHTCATRKQGLSHFETVALFRVIMCCYSEGSNKFAYRGDMYKQVSRLIAAAITYRTSRSSENAFSETLALLEAKSFKLTYADVMKHLRN